MQIRKQTKGELNVRDQVFSVVSFKMHCINESDNKFLVNQIKSNQHIIRFKILLKFFFNAKQFGLGKLEIFLEYSFKQLWVKPWKKRLNLMLAGSFTTEGLRVSYHLLFPRKLTLTQWLLNNIEQKERKRESKEAIAQTRYKQT